MAFIPNAEDRELTQFATLAQFQNVRVDAGTSMVLLRGLAAEGDDAPSFWIRDANGTVTDGAGSVWRKAYQVDPSTPSGGLRPENFGAIGDGVTDDSAAVQLFLNSLGEGSGNAGRLSGVYALGSTVYARNEGTVITGLVQGESGFKSLTADGFIQIGDDTDLGAISKPGAMRFFNVTFDGNFLGDVTCWVGFGCNEPAFYNCRFKGGVFAGTFVDQDVTAHRFVGCTWAKNGKSAAGTVQSTADGILTFGTGTVLDCVMGGASGCGVRHVAVGSDPTGTIGFVEESNFNVVGGRINKCYEELYRGEFHVSGDLVVSGSAEFQRGELVTGGTSGATGIFWRKIGDTVRLIAVQGTFTTETITGADSAASDTVTTAHTAPFGATTREVGRISFTAIYLENPGNYAGQDNVDCTQQGDGTFSIYLEGRRSHAQIGGGTKWQSRKVGTMLGAGHDAQIDAWFPPDFVANVDGDLTKRTTVARTFYEAGDDGVAQIRIRDWGGRHGSSGTSVDTDESLTPYDGWAGLVEGSPAFGVMSIVGPRMELIDTPLDGATEGLPGWSESRGTAAVQTTTFQSRGAAIEFTADGSSSGGRGINFNWTPPPELVGRRLMFVAYVNLEQVGGTFGGATGLPAPRIRVQSAAGSDKVWPDGATSNVGQLIPAPGASTKTGWFSLAVMAEQRSPDAVTITVSQDSQSQIIDDKMFVDRVEVYLVDDPAVSTTATGLFPVTPMRTLSASTTWNPGSLNNNAEETLDVTVPGAAMGDFAIASLSTDSLELTVTAQVTAADTVSVTLTNNFGSAVDLPSHTLRVLVIKA